MICMFDEDFQNNLQQALGYNLWPTHPTNWNYKIQLLKQTNCLLGFVSHSMPSRAQLKKSGQRTKPTQKRIPINHHDFFTTKMRMCWCQWWELAFRLCLQCQNLGMTMTKTRKKTWENHPWESTMKQFQIFKAPLLIIGV